MGDEDSTLMTGTGRLDDLAPPAPPKHKYGKVVGPQTVSFADFDESIPPALGPTHEQRPENAKPASMMRPFALQRMPSDLNKPLPPAPQSDGLLQQSQRASAEHPLEPLQQQTPALNTTVSAEYDKQAKKAAPPPPHTRRTSQIDVATRRARSTSNATQTSITQEDTFLGAKDADNTLKGAAPPPPPPRKGKFASQSSTPIFGTSPDGLPPAPIAADGRLVPPPPPRRNQAKAGNTVTRSPSAATRSSEMKNDQYFPSNSTAAPLPPPPRRGVTAKRDSMDSQRRASGQSSQSERSTSLSNVNGAIKPVEADRKQSDSASRDILADMDAFQAEIEALRVKALKNG